MKTVDLTSDCKNKSDDQMENHIMSETTQIKTEKQNNSIEIIELEKEESIQLIELEMIVQIINETKGIPQERRRSLRREATKPNRTKTPEPKKEERKQKRKPANK